MSGRRRPLQLGHVQATLEHLLILTWLVREDALLAKLPRGFKPLLHDGQAMVSALLFRNRSLRPAIVRFPRFRCTQLNIRSYVQDPVTGERGSVFFHGFHPGLPWLAWVSSRLFKIPCGSFPFQLLTAFDRDGRFSWTAVSRDRSVAVRAVECRLPDVVDSDLLDLLTNVHTGYAVDKEPGQLRTWGIWHPNQRVRTMETKGIRLEPLEGLRLGASEPDFAHYVDRVDYEIYLPASVFSLNCSSR